MRAFGVSIETLKPLLIYEYLQYVEKLAISDQPFYFGLIIIFGIIGLVSLLTLLEVLYFNIIIHMQIDVRSTIISSIYEKCQKIREIDNIGETVNYINIDCQRIETFFLDISDAIECVIVGVVYY